MSNYPDLSKADFTIMNIIWQEKEVNSKDILRRVEEILGWSRQTVRTYLNRLMDKGMIGVNVISPRIHVYYPLVSKDEYASDKTSDYLNDYFGDLSHMFAGLIKKEDVSDEQLDALEKMIKDYRESKER